MITSAISFLRKNYHSTENLHKKWQRAGQPEEIYEKFPKFVEFLDSSLLLSQMKATRDQARLVGGEPAILVEGNWMKESDLVKRFVIESSPFYKQKFAVDRETRDVYTYLDNGKGLEKHHPYLDIHPISTLSEEDYQKTLEQARKFIRPAEQALSDLDRTQRNAPRTFVLQVVTSLTPRGHHHFADLLLNPRHPYFRLLIGNDHQTLGTKNGEVYEIGFGGNPSCIMPLATSKGRFRSPDIWEYLSVDERIVTNIAITQEEAHKFYEFIIKFHKDSINLGKRLGFDFAHHNCTRFIHEAGKASSIEIPTGIDITEVISRITPDWVNAAGRAVALGPKTLFKAILSAKNCITPMSVSKLMDQVGSKLMQLAGKIHDLFLAVILTPIRAFLGGAFGKRGAMFHQPQEAEQEVGPPLRNFWNFFDISSYKMHLPGLVQEWQLKQPSTVRYANHPVRLAIVP